MPFFVSARATVLATTPTGASMPFLPSALFEALTCRPLGRATHDLQIQPKLVDSRMLQLRPIMNQVNIGRLDIPVNFPNQVRPRI